MSEIESHTIDPAATSPGAILKRCREYHEITLEEAEEATKIGASYLQALEEDQIKQFGNLAYLKGFLRIYATYLSLNPDDMIRLFDKLYSTGSSQVAPKKNGTATIDTPEGKKFPLQKLIMPAIILTLLLITSAIINRSTTSVSRQGHTTPASTQQAASALQPAHSSAKLAPPAKKPEEAATDPLKAEVQTAPQARPLATSADSAKGFIARMKVTQSGTLNVTIDGSTSQSYDLVVGDIIEWKADRTITLELSNSGGVEVDLNGKQLKPLGPNGKAAVVVLDADGIRP